MNNSPNDALRHAVHQGNPVGIINALRQGANPYDVASGGPHQGKSALELLHNHEHMGAFSPQMFEAITVMTNTLPTSADDLKTLHHVMMQSIQQQAFSERVMDGSDASKTRFNNQSTWVRMLSQSTGWNAYQQTSAYPFDMIDQQTKAKNTGYLEAELHTMRQRMPQPSFKPSFAVGKDNDYDEDLQRAPSVSATTVRPLNEQVFQHQFHEHQRDGNIIESHFNDQVGDYYHVLPKMNSLRLKSFRDEHKTTIASPNNDSKPSTP